MNHIRINEIQIENFKKIKKYSLKFAPNSNTLMGTNGAGKSTIFDAFTWCLFGKDSNDRKEFNFKPQDSEGATIPHLETTVLVLLKSGKETTAFSRTSREKWVRKRGQELAEFGGNDTVYSVNGVPCNAGEFALKVGAVINGDLFKLLSSPKYFHGLKWQEQRAILTGLVGEIVEDEILEGWKVADRKKLKAELKFGGLVARKRFLSESIKSTKKELAAMLVQMEEVRRSLPIEPSDTGTIEAVIAGMENELKSLDSGSSEEGERSLLNTRDEFEAKLFDLNLAQTKMVDDARFTWAKDRRRLVESILEIQNAMEHEEQDLKRLNSEIEQEETILEGVKKGLERSRIEWEEVNSLKFDFDGNCPTCGSAFSEGVKEEKGREAEKAFNLKQLERKRQLEIESENQSNHILHYENALARDKNNVLEKKKKILKFGVAVKGMEADLKSFGTEDQAVEFIKLSIEFQKLEGEFEELNSKYKALFKSVGVDEAKNKKEELRVRISEAYVALGQAKVEEKSRERLREVIERHEFWNKNLTELEWAEFLLLRYDRDRMGIVEAQINRLFQNVKFRLFEEQINGSIVECCETLIDGVPYYDANTASKLNAGLEIIAALNVAEQVTAPIFIDNRESVEKIIPMPGQVINLVFDPAYKELHQLAGK